VTAPAGDARDRAPAPKPCLYVASRSKHAPLWLQLREDGAPIIASWLDEAGQGQTDDWADLWRRCIEEAATADATIFYAEADDWDGMTGALAEVGAALGAGHPVFFVGTHPFPLLLKHPLVTICDSMRDAFTRATAVPRRSPEAAAPRAGTDEDDGELEEGQCATCGAKKPYACSPDCDCERCQDPEGYAVDGGWSRPRRATTRRDRDV
jgi:hypothetical protein